jgi:(E)-4-hydroxy-3-methylbut-2-enyl-diphosphate synthase
MKNNINKLRRKSKPVAIGKVIVGGEAPIAVQSMTKTKTEDLSATIAEIRSLETVGCDIIRCAVPNEKAAVSLKDIVREVNIPVVADIHFNYKLALMSLDAGVHKIRINPGNIGKRNKYLSKHLMLLK